MDVMNIIEKSNLEVTYGNNGSSRFRNIIKVDFNQREIFSQTVGFNHNVLYKIKPTQGVGSRSRLDGFL
jgi:hypothetical protein